MSAEHESELSSQELLALLPHVISVAERTGSLLRSYQGSIDRAAIVSKTSAVDLVSNADQDAEQLIRAELPKLNVTVGFIGEESPLPDLREHPFFWCVDPLDGTSNFLCGLPLWAVSIALVTPDLMPLLGVVHAPLLGKMWSAVLGHGAWVNDTAMSVRREPPGGGLDNSMLATGFPYDVTTADEYTNVELYSVMQRRFQKIRRLGSAAIDLAYVAEGTFDGMWELKLKPWDSAAGMLLVTEAGGHVCTLEGQDYRPGDLSMVCASTRPLLDLIMSLIGN